MAGTIILAFCVLILLAYIFDLTADKTKIPTVLLLIVLGMLLKESAGSFAPKIAVIEQALPILGTIGLIMIVLEGAMELELNNEKKGILKTSFFAALLPVLALSYILAFIFKIYGGYDFKNALINAIPFCVVSSSVAIPTVINFAKKDKEFVVYESSLSDILGVVFFNAVALNDGFSFGTLIHLGWQTILIIIISLIATLGVAYLISNIKHHIKFLPIIILVILIYQAAEEYHLSPLIFILIFGLFMGNLSEIKNIKGFERLPLKRFNLAMLRKESHQLGMILTEATFVVRAIFFIMFGFTIQISQLLNTDSLIWAFTICLCIYVVRSIQLLLFKLPMLPLFFIVPRGLITILLFYAIKPVNNLPIINKSLLLQVIIITSIMMMFGSIFAAKKQKKEKEVAPKDTMGKLMEKWHKRQEAE